MLNIGIINPSSPSTIPVDKNLIERFFLKKGLQPVFAPHVWNQERFLAGSDTERAQDIMAFFQDPKIDMIIALKGGYGSGRLLDLLDFDIIAQNRKPLIGFSDTTALQLALLARAHLCSITGFSPRRDITETGVDMLIEKTFDLYLKKSDFSVSLEAMDNFKALQAPLIGGTLCLIEELIGTPYCPDYTDCILFVEEVGEEPYKVDKMLTHLRLSGILDKIKALIIGNFYKCISSDEADGTMEQVIDDLHTRCPHLMMLKGLPYGHSDSRILLPIGQMVSIDENAILQIRYK